MGGASFLSQLKSVLIKKIFLSDLIEDIVKKFIEDSINNIQDLSYLGKTCVGAFRGFLIKILLFLLILEANKDFLY
jgi:hypothetical protein